MSAWTDFGFERVPLETKQARVDEVFDAVSPYYDLMNDCLSFGLHRLWKHHAVALAQVHPGETILDLAGGTGDLTRLLSHATGPSGQVHLVDINFNMLSQGRDKLIDGGIGSPVYFSIQDAACLALSANRFDLVCIGFGLRNFTDKLAALNSVYSVLKPGGRLLILEFSKPYLTWLDALYQLYLLKVLPFLGDKIVGDLESYRYLAESILKHPEPEALSALIQEAGFEDVQVTALLSGIVAIHKAYKY